MIYVCGRPSSVEPLAAWELGLSGNGTRHPLPALPWPLCPCLTLGVPPQGAPIPSQPQGDPGMVADREHPASPTLSSQMPVDGTQGRLGTTVAWLPWPVRQDDAPLAVSMAAAARSKLCEVWAAEGPPLFPPLETSSRVPSSPSSCICGPASHKGHCGTLQTATMGTETHALTPPCSPGKRGWVREGGGGKVPRLHQPLRPATPEWGRRALLGCGLPSPGLGGSQGSWGSSQA